MKRFTVGDRVRIDIPDADDPDHERLHREHGTVVGVLEDDAGQETGDSRDSYSFQVELQTGEIEHLRWRDLRPVPVE